MLKVIDDELDTETFINTRVDPHVRIINGALDDDPESPASIVLNGRVDTSTLRFLKIDDYQRRLADRDDIYRALKDRSVVPNIVVGVRGQDFVVDGDDYIIRSPAYIIDGWQRVGTALRLLDVNPNHPIRMFATIHFGTVYEWERKKFDDLNKNQKKVSPNHHLRNVRGENEAILTLYGLTHNQKDFPLFKKVCWSQNMERGELISAMTMCIVMQHLHAHRTKIGNRSADSVAATLKRAADSITLPIFRRNVFNFFALVNDCWPFSVIEFKHASPQIKSTFLYQLARLLSDHPAFWESEDRILFVSADDRRKLSKFPIRDSHVMSLSGTGGAAGKILYSLLRDHLNSGRRTNRLVSRNEQGGA